MRRHTDLRYVDNGKRASWAAIRSYILKRDGHTCQECFDVATEVDHIWPRRHGGDDSEQNLRAICGPCNKAKGDKVDLSSASLKQLMDAMDAAAIRLEAEAEQLETIFGYLDARIQANLPAGEVSLYAQTRWSTHRAIASAVAVVDVAEARRRTAITEQAS